MIEDLKIGQTVKPEDLAKIILDLRQGTDKWSCVAAFGAAFPPGFNSIAPLEYYHTESQIIGRLKSRPKVYIGDLGKVNCVDLSGAWVILGPQSGSVDRYQVIDIME